MVLLGTEHARVKYLPESPSQSATDNKKIEKASAKCKMIFEDTSPSFHSSSVVIIILKQGDALASNWLRYGGELGCPHSYSDKLTAITAVQLVVKKIYLQALHDQELARIAQHQTIDCGARCLAIAPFESSAPLALSFNPRPQLACV